MILEWYVFILYIFKYLLFVLLEYYIYICSVVKKITYKIIKIIWENIQYFQSTDYLYMQDKKLNNERMVL